MGRYKKRGIAHFGIDYFKCVIKHSEESLLFTLGRGSNEYNVSEGMKTYDKRYNTVILRLFDVSDKYRQYFDIRDRETNISLAFVGIGGKKYGREYARDFFEATGQGLILRGGVEWFFDLMDDMKITVDIFTRIDVCLDLINVAVAYFYSKLLGKNTQMKSGKIFYSEGKEQTIYFGEKSRKKNTYQLIRIYDKKADNKKKGKEYLYDYEKYDNITRLEIEIREDKAKFWSVEKITDINFIFAVIVKNFYRFNYQFFGFLKFDDYLKLAKFEKSIYHDRLERIRRRQEHFEAYGQSFRDDDERNVWISTFVSYGKRLIGDGYDSEKILFLLGLSPPLPTHIDQKTDKIDVF